MSKTALQIRADLRIDLKDSGALWSDAELNRCIERSVADFNRYLPDEKVYEDSLQFAVTGEPVKFPSAANAAAVVNAQSIDVPAGSLLTISGQPDVPRTLIITIVDADDSTYGATFIIRGTDKDEQYQEEIFHYTRGDSKTIPGKKEFKNVYEVELNQDYGSHALDTASVGYGLYTDAWIYLANSPIKKGSESATDADSAAIVRNTDFYIDYANGRVKAIASAKIAAEETCTFAYKKSQIGIDLSDLHGLIRVQRVEYPVGQVPQNFVQFDTFGKYVVVTGSGESEEQMQMVEDEQYRLYYDAKHHQPGEMSPGTIPEFLESTVETMTGAYALYIYALKMEHQAVTDMASARLALIAAASDEEDGAHKTFTTALTNLAKYLDTNTVEEADEDAAGILALITTDIAELRTAIETALSGTVGVEGMNPYLDQVGKATSGDIALADAVKALYMGTPNYVNGGTAPDIKAYLDTGDALLNEVAKGGEGQDVPRAYREYAQAVKDSLVAAFENDRAMYLQNATARTNAAMGYANEVAQRLSNLRSYIEQSASYIAISNAFGVEAEHRAADIVAYLQEGAQYFGAAANDTALAERFRAEADERRNEVYSIWRDRRQYIGDFTAGSMRQMP